MAAPVVAGVGTAVNGLASITVTADDNTSGALYILALETADQAITITGGNHTWTAVPSSPVSNATGATRLTMFYTIGTGSATPTAITSDSGDHQIGRIVRITGADTSDPFGAATVVTSIYSSASSATSVLPSVTTTVVDALVVGVVSHNTDNTNSAFSTISTKTQSDGALYAADNTSTGNGGGFTFYAGSQATTGTTALATLSHGFSCQRAAMSLAIKPAVPILAGTLTDTFTSGTLDTSKWNVAFGTTSVTGGRFRLNVDSGYTRLDSASKLILKDSQLAAQVFMPGQGSTDNSGTMGVEVYFQLSLDNNNYVLFYWGHSGIEFAFATAGASTSNGTVTYDPSAHAYIRFREASGTLYWETSPDNGTWTVQRSVTTPAWITSTAGLQFQLLTGYFGTVTGISPAYTEIDNVNVAAPVAWALSLADGPTAIDYLDYRSAAIAAGATAHWSLDETALPFVDSISGLSFTSATSVTYGASGLVTNAPASRSVVLGSAQTSTVSPFTSSTPSVAGWSTITTIGDTLFMASYTTAGGFVVDTVSGGAVRVSYITTGGSVTSVTGSAGAVAAGTPFHWAVTFTGSLWKAYVNGVEVLSGLAGAFLPATSAGTTKLVSSGSVTVDEFSAFPTSLTPAQVTNLYNAGRATYPIVLNAPILLSLTDSAATSDSNVRAIDYGRTLTATATASDAAPTRVADHAANLSDTATSADANTNVAAHALALTDSSTASDSAPASAASFAVSVTDSSTATDGNARVWDYGRALADNASAVDASSSTADHVVTRTDSATASDSAATQADHTLALTDGVTPTDAIASATDYALAVTDSVTASDSTAIAEDFALALADGSTTTDSVATAEDYSVSIADSVSTTDSNIADTTQAYTLALTDTASAADSYASNATYERFADDAATSADANARATDFAVSLSDTATATDTAPTTNGFVPTRLYLGTADSDVTTTAKPGTWSFASATANKRLTSVEPTTSAEDTYSLTSSPTVNTRLLTFVSDALAAQTIKAGEIHGQVRLKKGSGSGGGRPQLAVGVWRAADGTVDTLFADTSLSTTPSLATSYRNFALPASGVGLPQTYSDTSVAAGDRLVVVVGVYANNGPAFSQAQNYTLEYGAKPALPYLPATDVDTISDGDPWIEFGSTITFVQDYTLNLADGSTATDSTVRATAYALAESDSATTTDSSTSTAVYARTLDDSATAVEGANAEADRYLALTDSAAVGDATDTVADHAKGLADSVVFTDTNARIADYARATSDAVTPTDATARVASLYLELEDAADAMDDAAAAVSYAVDITDNASAVDSATSEAVYARVLTDTARILDTSVSAVGVNLTFDDVAGVTDAHSWQVIHAGFLKRDPDNRIRLAAHGNDATVRNGSNRTRLRTTSNSATLPRRGSNMTLRDYDE